MIWLEMQMDMLWVLFGSTTKVRPMSISEQNATSRNQVTDLAETLLLFSICTLAVFSRTFCWCCRESSPTYPEGQTKKYHWLPQISAAMQACILHDFFQYKPHHSLNAAKLTLVITDSPRCLLIGNHMGKKMQTTFPRLDPAHENKSYWPSPWRRVSPFWYLCLFPTLLFQFEFLILSICSFSFSFSTSKIIFYVFEHRPDERPSLLSSLGSNVLLGQCSSSHDVPFYLWHQLFSQENGLKE